MPFWVEVLYAQWPTLAILTGIAFRAIGRGYDNVADGIEDEIAFPPMSLGPTAFVRPPRAERDRLRLRAEMLHAAGQALIMTGAVALALVYT